MDKHLLGIGGIMLITSESGRRSASTDVSIQLSSYTRSVGLKVIIRYCIKESNYSVYAS